MIELLRRFGGKFRRYMVIGPACKLIEVIFDLLTPLVIAQMIDKGIGAHDVNAVVRYGAVLAAMAVIGISFTLVCQKMAALTSQGMGTDIRGALYQHINKLSYAELDRFGTPSLITRITNDVNQVQLAVALGVRMLIRWPFLAVGSMVAALAIDLKLGMIFLICTPAIGLVFWFVMARCIPYYKQLQTKLDRIALICREGLSGARVVRAFVREDHERERFAQAADDQAHVAIAVGKLSSILNPVTFLVMNLGVCAILWVGGIQVECGRAHAGPGHGVCQLHDADAHLHRVRRQPGRGLYQGERQRVAHQRGAQLRAEHYRRGQRAGRSARAGRRSIPALSLTTRAFPLARAPPTPSTT